MKETRTISLVVAVVLALWLGYLVGHHNGVEHGVQKERQAWLATAQTPTLSQPSVGGTVQRPRISVGRPTYSNPHSGGTVVASLEVGSGPPRVAPVNMPDLRDTRIK
jgi:hypothetical protein